MAHRIITVFVVSLCLCGFTNAQGDVSGPNLDDLLGGTRDSKPPADITFDQDPPFDYSGDGKFFTSDDEDYGVSGSGSGSGFSVYDPDAEIGDVFKGRTETTTTTTSTTTTTTEEPKSKLAEMTQCERQRHLSMMRYTNYVPKCNSNGDFEALQCHGHPGTSDCFCVDLHGRQIAGTLMERPNFPSCDEGYNLPNCTYQMVKSARLLGSRRPECTTEGLFKKVQCIGSGCHCVDQYSGVKKLGTETHLPDRPNCGDEHDEVLFEKTTRRPDTKYPVDTSYESDKSSSYDGDIILKEDEDGTIDLDQTIHELPDSFDTDDTDDTSPGRKFPEEQEDPDSSDDEEDNVGPRGNQDSSHGHGQKDRVEKASEILTQPGILAGIIGAAVVLLLCFVLLIMFVVYRMRKKDEGSYPLDEPRRGPPNYSYVRAPDKEYYA